MTTKYQETEQARNDRAHYRDGIKHGAILYDELVILSDDCQLVERMVGDDWRDEAVAKLQAARRRAKTALREAAKRGNGRERGPRSVFCGKCIQTVDGCGCPDGPQLSAKARAEMERPIPPHRHCVHYREGMRRGGIHHEDLERAANSCYYTIEIVNEGWPEEATKHLRDNLYAMKIRLDQARKRAGACKRPPMFAFCDGCDPRMNTCPCDTPTT